MIEVFRIEDRRTEAFRGSEKGSVIIFEPIPARGGEARSDICMIDGNERERAEKYQPPIDFRLREQLFAARDIGEFGQTLPRNSEE